MATVDAAMQDRSNDRLVKIKLSQTAHRADRCNKYAQHKLREKVSEIDKRRNFSVTKLDREMLDVAKELHRIRKCSSISHKDSLEVSEEKDRPRVKSSAGNKDQDGGLKVKTKNENSRNSSGRSRKTSTNSSSPSRKEIRKDSMFYFDWNFSDEEEDDQYGSDPILRYRDPKASYEERAQIEHYQRATRRYSVQINPDPLIDLARLQKHHQEPKTRKGSVGDINILQLDK